MAIIRLYDSIGFGDIDEYIMTGLLNKHDEKLVVKYMDGTVRVYITASDIYRVLDRITKLIRKSERIKKTVKNCSEIISEIPERYKAIISLLSKDVKWEIKR
jgi:hypothetical protein